MIFPVLITIYMACMFDFPIRRGRNLFVKYKGIMGMLYYIYGLFFSGVTISTSVLLSDNLTYYLIRISPYFGELSGIAVFFLFPILTIKVVGRRSRNEMFLLKLQEEYPHMYEVD